ncbi:MAG: putative regulatory protein [Bacteroidetes bacterium]|nr:putative regulatory protein [Bacteroidota bacterium]
MDPALDKAPNGYVTFNDRGIIIAVNDTLCAMLNYTKTELEGAKFESVLNIAGRIFFQTHFFPLLKMQKKVDEIFLNLSAKDSSLIPVITSSLRNEERDPVINTCVILPVHNRRKYEEEILAAKRQAEEALRENRALTEARREADLHSLELDKKILQLNQVNNNLLQFNNIINHEMQECVRKILVFSRLGRTEDDEDYLLKITQTANRLKVINSSLNAFIGLGLHEGKFEEVDLNSCLDEACLDVLKKTGFEALNFKCDKLPVVEGLFADLKMLFYHLISNSVKFRKQDEVTINVTSVIYQDNIYKMNDRKYDYQDVVRLTITDNGKGFDNKHKEYVFAILKQLNHESPGSGIGLAICKKVLDNHQGSISIDSTEQRGTTVTIVLPLKQY